MNLKTFSILALIVLVFSFAALGQERIITQKQYQAADSAAWKFLEDNSYRTTETREMAGRSEPSLTTTIYESIPPDRSRSLVTEKADGVTTTTETIEIGDKIFMRKNGEKWTIEDPRSNRFSISGTPVKDERVTEFKLTPDVMLGDEKTDFYEQNETITYKSLPVPTTNSWTRRFWLDKKGLMLRSEYIFRRADGGILHKSATVYEYDLKIKIEAPIKVTANKKK